MKLGIISTLREPDLSPLSLISRKSNGIKPTKSQKCHKLHTFKLKPSTSTKTILRIFPNSLITNSTSLFNSHTTTFPMRQTPKILLMMLTHPTMMPTTPRLGMMPSTKRQLNLKTKCKLKRTQKSLRKRLRQKHREKLKQRLKLTSKRKYLLFSRKKAKDLQAKKASR